MATTDRGAVITDTTEGPDRAPPSRRMPSVVSVHQTRSTVAALIPGAYQPEVPGAPLNGPVTSAVIQPP